MKVWDISADKPEFIFERNVKLGVLQVIDQHCKLKYCLRLPLFERFKGKVANFF